MNACLLRSMAAVQAVDVLHYFRFVLHHHQDGWALQTGIVMMFQPLTMRLYLVANSWLSTQLMHVVELDLLLTDILDLVLMTIVASIYSSDHSSLSSVI